MPDDLTAAFSTPPAPTTPLVGRSAELAAIVDAVRPGRLVTLTGTGGVGKTRLAIEASRQLAERLTDPVVTVWLGSVTEGSQVLAQIGRAGGWHVGDERSVDEIVLAQLTDRPALVVLDNCEQVVGLGRVIDLLLRRCPRAAVLATSRRPLASQYEHVAEIEPLPVATSLELLVDAVRRNDPHFTVNDSNRAALTELVTRLDGVPLALHLAAARLHLTTPDEMVRLLDQRFAVLKGSPSFEAPHHARLVTMIEWSYRLQTDTDRQRFRALGVFPHTFTRHAAAAIAGCDPIEMLDTLHALVDHHLVRTVEREGAAARFGLLESIREFALAQLAEHGELDTARRAHAEWVAVQAELDGPRVAGGDEQAWASLSAEIDNVRAATAWGVEHDPRLVLRLGVLWRFWQRSALVGEGIDALTRALTDAEETGEAEADAVTAHAMRGLANLHDDYGALDDAVRWARRAVAAYERLGDRGELARAWVCLAHPLREHGELDRASDLYTAAAETFQELGWSRDETTALNGLAAVAYRRGDFATAVTYWEQCLELVRRLNDPESAILISTNVGIGRFGVGDLRGALDAYAESIELAERIGTPTLVCTGLLNRTEVLLTLGETGPAREHLDRLDELLDADDRRLRAVLHCHRGVLAEREGRLGDALREHATGLQMTLDTGRSAEAAEMLEYATRVAAGLDELTLAGRLLAAAHQIRNYTGTAPVDTLAADLLNVRERVTAASAALGDEAPTAEEALRDLRAAATRRAGERRSVDGADAPLRALGLTPRESEVARLLAARRTDPEIAAELFIGVRTVATHVSAVLRKLGVKSRRDVAAKLAEVEPPG